MREPHGFKPRYSNQLEAIPRIPQSTGVLNCLKRLGELAMSSLFERQAYELRSRAAIPKRFTELDGPQAAAAAH